MEITVRLFAGLRERAGGDTLALAELPAALDVAALLRALEERHPELGALAHVRAVRADEWLASDEALADGDEVALVPPVSGGAPDDDELLEAGAFELSADPLDAGGIAGRVGHPSCGGTCTFLGTTRERNRERDVVRLDYEAFASMAGAEMERIFGECRARFGPEAEGEGDPLERRLRMLVVHRTGTVGIGEASIAIAVASPHRDAAFGACRFLIDELKARVPLWKKEVYADGHHWIGERS